MSNNLKNMLRILMGLAIGGLLTFNAFSYVSANGGGGGYNDDKSGAESVDFNTSGNAAIERIGVQDHVYLVA